MCAVAAVSFSRGGLVPTIAVCAASIVIGSSVLPADVGGTVAAFVAFIVSGIAVGLFVGFLKRVGHPS